MRGTVTSMTSTLPCCTHAYVCTYVVVNLILVRKQGFHNIILFISYIMAYTLALGAAVGTSVAVVVDAVGDRLSVGRLCW